MPAQFLLMNSGVIRGQRLIGFETRESIRVVASRVVFAEVFLTDPDTAKDLVLTALYGKIVH